MNKINFTSTLLFLFSIITPYLLFAQPDRPPIDIIPDGTVLVDGEGGDQKIFICADEDGQISLEFSVKVVNLTDWVLNEAETTLIYSLPDDVDDMYIKFSIDGINFDYIPVTDFYSVDEAFYAYIDLGTFDFGLECIRTTGEIQLDELVIQIVTYSESYYDYATGQWTTQGYETYPFCENTGVGDIFDCDIMNYIFCGKFGEGPCNDEEMTTLGSRIVVDCNCYHEGESDTRFNKGNEIEIATISPNPAHEILNFEFKDGADYQITLFGLDGMKVKQWSKKGANGNYERYAIDDIAPGLYIIEIKSGAQYQISQIIKQ